MTSATGFTTLIKLHDQQLINDKYCAYYWKHAEDKKLLSS